MKEIINYSQHHIYANMRCEEQNLSWLFTGFYGHPEVSKRKAKWNLLSMLNPSLEIPWCIIGAFNEIISQYEKVGGRPRPEVQIEDFRKALEVNGVYNLGWKGNRYTWRISTQMSLLQMKGWTEQWLMLMG